MSAAFSRRSGLAWSRSCLIAIAISWGVIGYGQIPDQDGKAAPASAPSQSTEKKPGTLRIGVTEPKVQMGQGNSGPNVADPLRSMIAQSLTGRAFDVVSITAALPTQIDAEAIQKQCDYVLYSQISLKAKSGGMGLLSKLGPAAGLVPGIGPMGGIAAIAMSTRGSADATSGGSASTIRAKGDVVLDYRLTTPGNATPILAKTLRSKAKSDQDVIPPLVEQAATAILNELSQKK